MADSTATSRGQGSVTKQNERRTKAVPARVRAAGSVKSVISRGPPLPRLSKTAPPPCLVLAPKAAEPNRPASCGAAPRSSLSLSLFLSLPLSLSLSLFLLSEKAAAPVQGGARSNGPGVCRAPGLSRVTIGITPYPGSQQHPFACAVAGASTSITSVWFRTPALQDAAGKIL